MFAERTPPSADCPFRKQPFSGASAALNLEKAADAPEKGHKRNGRSPERRGALRLWTGFQSFKPKAAHA